MKYLLPLCLLLIGCGCPKPGPQGPSGVQGIPGPTAPYGAVSTIAPCGFASSPYKEELMCLNNGQVLASFSKTMAGDDTRFVIMPAGSYVDTDESACHFSVAINAHGDTSVSWVAGSNVYSTWGAQTITCVNNS